MRNYSSIFIVKTIWLILIILLPVVSFAQPDPGEDPDLPIDGGVGLLIAAGVGYGIKKVRDERKKKRHAGL